MKLKFILPLATAGVLASACAPHVDNPGAPTNDEVILHAWSWSFDTIAANMKDIAAAGYTYVQTSPANTCYVGDDGGMALFSKDGDTLKGKWYYYYQPTDWKIGNYMLGSREQLKAMLDSANKYGVKVIVDVLPNHTAFDRSAVLPDLNAAAGGHDSLYHANGFNDITEWNDRYQCTTGAMGGLPDVNTENPGFQKYYMQYVNDLIGLGVRGFRYDTAKHIGLPSDPLDKRSKRNNFWLVATGREAVDGVKLAIPVDSLLLYGEVLQDKNVKEEEYAEYMDMTASAYGHHLRDALDAHNFRATNLMDWANPVSPSKLVTWVESHDTYCNAHESAHMPDELVRVGWVFLTARQQGMPLFFSRPMGSTRQNYWGNNRIGARGNDEFKHPEVVAANKFRHAMQGQPETVTPTANGGAVMVQRGKAGAALINFTDKPQTVKLASDLPAGKYKDWVHGSEFMVKDGFLTGTLQPLQTYIISTR